MNGPTSSIAVAPRPADATSAPPDAAGAPASAAPLHLPGGERLLVRAVRAHDADAEQVFVRSLSPRSRALRFHFGLRELSPQALRALTDVDPRHHVALVVQREGEAALVADARYVREADDEGVAEFAIAVADDWQGRGLGRRLLVALIEHARRQGLRRLYGDVLHENRRMIALLREAGGRFVPVAGDARLARGLIDLY